MEINKREYLGISGRYLGTTGFFIAKISEFLNFSN